jgi:two-component system chemotaxis response regulator CheB
MSAAKKIRVLIVDDSAVARDLLERGLSLDPDIEVVGKAADVYAARDKIVFLKPDVITLDVEMPRMDGIEFLKRLMPQYPVAAVVVSAVTVEGSRRALEALDAGALEVVAKPSAGDRAALKEMLADLVEKVKSAAGADLSKLMKDAKPVSPASRLASAKVGHTAFSASSGGPRTGSRRLIAIGASTGGTTALHRVIEALPADVPPIVIVQHMPPVFTRMFAEALNRSSAVQVLEAEDGTPVRPGTVLIAQGDLHMRLAKRFGELVVVCENGPKVSGHRPSVDVLFNSVADVVGPEAIGVLLTGMGRDGADGMVAMARRGAHCLAQDEASSVVWGMPREAWEAGAAEKLVPLDEMTREILALVGRDDSGSGHSAGSTRIGK